MQSITQEQAAAIVGLSSRRLRQLSNEGDPPQLDEFGQFPPESFGQWLRRRITSDLGVSNDGKVYDLNIERARLTKAQADKTELEVKEIRGEVIRLPLIEQHWQSMVASMRAKLLSLPTKAAAQTATPEKLQQVTDILQALVYEALSEIAGDAIPNEVRDRVAAQGRATDQDTSETAAEADVKSVGKREANPKPRGQRRARKISTH